MKKNYNFPKSAKMIILAFIFTILLVASGCYTIAYITQPTEVAPNSTFDVKVCVKSDENWGYDDYVIGYGIFGILLPEGWTVKDSVPFFKAAFINSYNVNGFFCYNDDVVSFLNNSLSTPPEGYYWWGAKSINRIDLAYFDSGYVNVTLKTDEKIGDFNIKYILGDDSDWNKSILLNPYTIIDNKSFKINVVDMPVNAENIPVDMDIQVFPNPAINQVTFTWETGYNQLNLKIFQLTGACVTDKVIKSNETVHLGKIPKGIYLYELLDKKQILKTGKIIIQ